MGTSFTFFIGVLIAFFRGETGFDVGSGTDSGTDLSLASADASLAGVTSTGATGTGLVSYLAPSSLGLAGVAGVVGFEGVVSFTDAGVYSSTAGSGSSIVEFKFLGAFTSGGWIRG